MTLDDAQERLGFRIEDLQEIEVATMLGSDKDQIKEDLSEKDVSRIKDEVYGVILQYLDMEGYPSEGNGRNECNVCDLVLYVVGPVLSSYHRKTSRNVRLWREREILSVDHQTGGRVEFVIVELVDVGKQNFILLVEAKRSSLAKAEKQLLLSLKDLRDNNGSGEVYGFATIGESWRMFKYDGVSFCKTEKMDILFEPMKNNKKRWLKNCSELIDCIIMAMRNGGMVKKAVAVGTSEG